MALVIAVLPAVLPARAGADPISDQKAVVAHVTDQLNAMERQSDALGEQYLAAIGDKQRLDAEVSASQQRIAAQQSKVDTMHGQLAEVAVRAYMGAGTSGGSPIFSTTAGVTDSLARDQLSRVASNSGAATTDEYEAALDQLHHEQAGLAHDRAAAAAKAKQISAAKQAAEPQAAVFTKAQADAKAKLGDLIQQEQERRARESFLRLQQQAAAAAAAAAAAQQAAAQRAAAQEAAAQQAAAQRAQPAEQVRALGAAPVARPADPPATPAAPPPPPAARPPSSRAGIAVAAAMSQLGVPYRFAAATPGVAFDCSGLTMWAWAQAGVSMPHQSAQQAAVMPHVPKQDAQPGDLLFIYAGITHVTIYLGNGQNISAPHTGAVVHVSAVNWNDVVAVGRPG